MPSTLWAGSSRSHSVTSPFASSIPTPDADALAVVVGVLAALGHRGEENTAVSQAGRIREAQAYSVDLAEVVTSDRRHGAGFDAAAGKRIEHRAEVQRDDCVHRAAAIAALKQQQLPAAHRGSLDVEIGNVPIEYVVQRPEVQPARLAGQRTARVEVPDDTAPPLRLRPRSERKERAGEQGERLQVGLLALPLLGVRGQLARRNRSRRPGASPFAGNTPRQRSSSATTYMWSPV